MSQKIRRLKTQIRRQGLISATHTNLHSFMFSSMEIVFRHVLEPSLRRLASSVSLQSMEGTEILKLVLREATSNGHSITDYTQIDSGGGFPTTLADHYARLYPRSFQMEKQHLDLLGELIHLTHPSNIAETGVADGFSTRTILQALADNDFGQLTSFDVHKDVGSVIEPVLRKRWNLVILPKTGRRDFLSDKLALIHPLDIFVHDSDHSYSWQRMEFHLAFNRLRPGGLLISDDVDASYAFIDFVREMHVPSFTFVGSSKVMGIAIKPALGETLAV